MKKSVIAILTAAAILLSSLGPMLYTPTVRADEADWYTTVNGVLSSDYYTLYPYASDSLDFGLSKFGEMIDGTGLLPDVGLQYPGYEVVETYDQRLLTSRDPFANEGVPKNLWLNGWLLEARYTHRTRRDRRLLAMAMYADMTSFGGDWLTGHALPLESAPFGGRKTTGYAETEPMQVLYDGPRRWVALCTTHLYDWADGDGDEVVDHPDETWAVLDIMLTFIFNKVKKEVIILKDIKIVISGKALDSPVDVQFSNREEWDLGPSPDWDSYAHFYHQEMETCYGPDWHMAPGIMREFIYKGLGAINGVPVWSEGGMWGPPIANGSVRVYVNGEFKEEGTDYFFNYNTGAITWYMYLAYTDEVEVLYKLWKYDVEVPMEGVPHLYDVAQIISSDGEYVGWKAFWPTLSDYTVDGWAVSFEPLLNVSQPDIIPIEPEIPFVIGEWDFMLGKEYPLQFRGVEVLGLTDFHDAEDAQGPDTDGDQIAENTIDREAMYQLDEVFNPWDLYDAVHKKSMRWVEFFDGDAVTTDFQLTWEPLDPIWDKYCTFAERVLVDGALQVPTRVIPPRVATTYTYTVDQWNATTWGINFTTAPPDDAIIKVLYSTDNVYYWVDDNSFGPGRYEWFVVGRDAHTVDSLGAGFLTATVKQKTMAIGIGGMDMMGISYSYEIPYLLHRFGTDNAFQDYFLTPETTYPGQRLTLRDDWCHTWPISSSNIISVGGPSANWVTMYFNDFTDAFYAAPWFTPYADWSGKLAALTCWNKNAYANTGEQDGIGYAMIGTYKDINGTVGLAIYGLDGRDTYYASQWFHDNIEQVQDFPLCLTSIIIEIDYEDPEHPEFDVVECLGTISEALVHDVKGGIHDP